MGRVDIVLLTGTNRMAGGPWYQGQGLISSMMWAVCQTHHESTFGYSRWHGEATRMNSWPLADTTAESGK